MRFRGLKLVPGDLLICSGDACNYGYVSEFVEFSEWFMAQPFTHKIFVPGNHDRCLDISSVEDLERYNVLLEKTAMPVFTNDIFVIDGLLFATCSFTPPFRYWAFQKNPTAMRQEYNKLTAKIEDSGKKLNFLITHGPPFGTLDIGGAHNDHLGCEVLAEFVEIHRPKYHVFGHIHESYGVKYNYNTGQYSVNCALNGVREPVYLEL